MIDTTSETVVTFSEACKLLPRRRRNKRPSVATIYRWASDGVRGVKLEFLCVGGSRCTSREALQRFFAALTHATQERSAADSNAETEAAAERAEMTLAAAGV